MLRSRYIVWRPFYDVGHCTVDQQHRQIIDSLNELYTAIHEDRDPAAMRPVLDRLVDYTEQHFEYEEEMLEEYGYPGFEQHKAAHDRTRRKSIELRESLSPTTGRDLLATLKDWWVGHIQRQDKDYVAFLEAPVHA